MQYPPQSYLLTKVGKGGQEKGLSLFLHYHVPSMFQNNMFLTFLLLQVQYRYYKVIKAETADTREALQ